MHNQTVKQNQNQKTIKKILFANILMLTNLSFIKPWLGITVPCRILNKQKPHTDINLDKSTT